MGSSKTLKYQAVEFGGYKFGIIYAENVERIEDPSWHINPYYTTQDVRGERAMIKNGTITATLTHRPIVPGSVVVTACCGDQLREYSENKGRIGTSLELDRKTGKLIIHDSYDPLPDDADVSVSYSYDLSFAAEVNTERNKLSDEKHPGKLYKVIYDLANPNNPPFQVAVDYLVAKWDLDENIAFELVRKWAKDSADRLAEKQKAPLTPVNVQAILEGLLARGCIKSDTIPINYKLVDSKVWLGSDDAAMIECAWTDLLIDFHEIGKPLERSPDTFLIHHVGLSPQKDGVWIIAGLR